VHERRSLRSPTGRFIAERGDSERVHAPLSQYDGKTGLSRAHLRLADLFIGESRTYWLRSSAAGGEFIGRIREISNSPPHS
jgi:hypothetical protein